MRQCDHDMEVREDARIEANEDKAIKHIRFCIKKGILVEDIRENLEEDYGYNENEIDELFIKAGVQKDNTVQG